MVNLSFIELTTKKENDTNTNKNNMHFLTAAEFKSAFNLCCFVTNDVNKIEKIHAKDVTKSLADGTYVSSAKYTIIYLYDIELDPTSKDFLLNFGSKLHNRTSMNIALLTYYDQKMVDAWKNVYVNVPYASCNDICNIKWTINKIQRKYGVNNLPAMIILSKDSDDFIVKDFSQYKTINEIYESFSYIIDIIDDNCMEDFSHIKNKISISNAKTVTKNKKEGLDVFNFVNDLVKGKEGKGNENYTTLNDLAEAMGVDVKGLYYKRDKKTFTRDECLFLGITFGVELSDLNELLRLNNKAELSILDRDGIIRTCLLNGSNIDETNKKLKQQGYDTIKLKKTEA